MKKQYDCDCYIICHNGSNIIHPSKVTNGTFLASGQPHVEEFSTEEEWKARLTELGYDISKLDPPSPLKRSSGALRERVSKGTPGGLLGRLKGSVHPSPEGAQGLLGAPTEPEAPEAKPKAKRRSKKVSAPVE